EALAGLVPLRWGEIRLGGRRLSSASVPKTDLRPGRRGIGLLRQNAGLFPHLTVEQNIAYAPGVDPAAARATGVRLGLGGLLGARPRGLSGGEAQRVALARALQTEVQVICLDEPFNSLDRPLARELLDLLLGELSASATSAVLVTHQLEEAQAFADRVAVLDRGRILQESDPIDLVLHPASRVVAELVGYRGFLSSGEQTIALHPDRLEAFPSAGEGRIPARVIRARPQGARFELELEAVGRWRGRFRHSAARPAIIGEQMWFAAPDAPLFPSEGEFHGG
ncbi:MAG TPA: ATP-binding cassette domain-containing protein, partial [Candidatus Dormibacteraeota bacterium]